MRSLNLQQRDAVLANRRWLKEYIRTYNMGLAQPAAYFFFISGAGGVEKSHVIQFRDWLHKTNQKLQTWWSTITRSRRCMRIGYSTDRHSGIKHRRRNDTLCPHDIRKLFIQFIRWHPEHSKNGKLTVLVIDEISMVSAELLPQRDRWQRQVKIMW